MAWAATLVAARGAALAPAHLRFRPRAGAPRAFHCFVLDCSASMLDGGRLARAKGLLVSLFDAAARERAEVALICFGAGGAERRFGPAVPRWWNERWLEPVAGGGGTPLALGIDAARALLAQLARRRPGAPRSLWLLTDGRTDEMPARPAQADEIHLVDFDDAAVRLGRAERLARAWEARWWLPEMLIRD
ncbi:VWA domain-containing protein [Burkholderia plantarii]|nr:VWA domain-containing protein [Burkholderia plantarii]WLE60866.1 VWA domain-containing protein [Burkholderia plantarii]